MGNHTISRKGRRVIVILTSGRVIVDRFGCRKTNNRWIELEHAGRIPREELKCVADMKGDKVDLKRIGLPAHTIVEDYLA